MFTIDGYEIKQPLGQGGMATVYLAHEQKLDRKVALKVMIPSPTQDQSICTRFLKEARTVANLHHSNIVSIYDVGEQGGVYYMAMEYLPGSNLRDRILNGSLTPDQALSVTRQLASALGHAHEEGYIHRDIKPENVLFRKDGTPVLTDFGIAKAVGSTTKMTKTGMSIGTPHYMSPEQARGKTLDGRSDLYSLGIVFYEMLTGRVPYEAEDSIAIAVKHIQEPIPELPGHLSQYQSLINKLLAKDSNDRFQSGSELVSVLENPLGQAEASAAPTTDSVSSSSPLTSHHSHSSKSRIPNPDPPTRKPLVIGLGIALAVLVVILIALLNQGKGESEKAVTKTAVEAPSGVPAKPVEDPVAKQDQVYDSHIASARRALSSSDLDMAAREIDRAKAIRSGNEVALLEQNLKASIEKKQQAEREETARKQMDRLREEQRRIEESRLAEDRRQAEVEKQRQEAAEAEKARREEAARLAAAEEKARAVNIEMVPIPGRNFMMGKYEVTQGQWRAVMGNNPSNFQKGDNYPVENVSWDDCQEFIRKLNQQTGKRYRLPSEAEWEYACRGGTSGDRYGDIDDVAWYDKNSGDSTHPVGQKRPNNYGLYDTLGNVWEWCEDWYDSSHSFRVYRGGSWFFTAGYCRAPFRSWDAPVCRGINLGFRLAAVSL